MAHSKKLIVKHCLFVCCNQPIKNRSFCFVVLNFFSCKFNVDLIFDFTKLFVSSNFHKFSQIQNCFYKLYKSTKPIGPHLKPLRTGPSIRPLNPTFPKSRKLSKSKHKHLRRIQTHTITTSFIPSETNNHLGKQRRK